jgi:Uma2 family endonuclease
MARPARAFVTEEDFLALPETVDKVELIDGEVMVAPSPSFYHQEVVGRLSAALRHWAAGRGAPVTVGQAPLDVRFAPGRILQPDVFVLFDRIAVDHQGPIERVPELCVEVLSGRPSYDRFTKRVIYADAGVRELWTVEPGHFVEQWTGAGLRDVSTVDATLETSLLPGFSMELAVLFRE